jgi:AcrR family transcriptional regulator
MVGIEVAGLEQLVARGYANTTAEHIAAAADVSVRTFFRYFPRGKEDLLVLEFRRLIFYLEQSLRERPPQESAWVALRHAVRDIQSLSGDVVVSRHAVALHRELARADPNLHASAAGSHYALAEPLVMMAATRMSVDPAVDIRPRLMVHALLAAAMVSWLAWLGRPESFGPTVFEHALDLLEVGFGTALHVAATDVPAAAEG